MDEHSWFPISSDFTEWKCDKCGWMVAFAGPPCRNLRIPSNFKISAKTDEEDISFSCTEIAQGILLVLDVHEA
jgi:hypothetical protein